VVERVKKERIDKLLVERGLCESRAKAQALLLAGQVVVGEQRVEKAGALVPYDAPIRLKEEQMPYVSRGGLKLEAAIRGWSVRVDVPLALDLGASTGGFTDCLLAHGCRKVIAVDVGYGQLHPKLRDDPRVINLERMNARYLTREQIPLEGDTPISLVVADLSFISLELVIAPLVALLAEGGEALLLIKPQFEAGREFVGHGGVVRETAIRERCADAVSEIAARYHLQELARMDCPVHGPKGNIEILMWLRKHLPAAQEAASQSTQSGGNEGMDANSRKESTSEE
jgi:23S rRNA (cytidine1920-2'-O)/16S rRNA (cytidine1409-2'-O)-methyltransferase